MTSRLDFINRFAQEPFVEIGVFEGEFSKEILGTGLKDVTLVDPWFPGTTIFSGDKDGRDCRTVDADQTAANVIQDLGDRCKVLRETSAQFWSKTPDASLGSVYIDGDHSYEAVRLDLREALRCVRPGGYIMGHDYTMPAGLTSGVKQAVDELVYPCEFTTLDGCSSFAFRRPKRLVYTVACHDREFASLIEFFPVRDALVICDPLTQDLIPDTFQQHVLTFAPKSPQEASYQKLRVFEFAPGYDEYMFMDLDITSRDPVDISKSWIRDPEKLHVVRETLWDVRHHADMRAPTMNPRPFNAGQFTFTAALGPAFEHLYRQCLTRPEDSYYEQGFMNDFFRDCAEFPFEEFVHFTGPNKRERILKFKGTMAPRKVMIATPSYDGRLDVWYVNALVQTIKDTEARGYEVHPIFMSYDALVQRSRNDLVALAALNDFDDLIFIDGDIDWDPSWVNTLLRYKVDVVGGTYRKKSDDREEYVCKSMKNPADVDTKTGLMKVDGLGAGFLRLSAKAIKHLWDTAEPYVDGSGKQARMVFEVKVIDGELVSEDIMMCRKLKEGGFDIHMDPRMCCGHSGQKRFVGNFVDWYGRFLEELAASAAQKVEENAPTN